jgi:DNA-binding NtrC family response regulator
MTATRNLSDHASTAPTKSEHILFIDDDVFLVSAGREMLERLGYRVTALSNPVTALETFRADPDRFDLVITDHVMPEMSGVELAREILKTRPRVPVVLCTAFGHMLTPRDATQAGFLEYVQKPIGMRELGLVIRRVLDRQPGTPANATPAG